MPVVNIVTAQLAAMTHDAHYNYGYAGAGKQTDRAQKHHTAYATHYAQL